MLTSDRFYCKSICLCTAVLSINVVFFAGQLQSARAATLLVANNGIDSSICGTPGNPCRSISQAISNAVPGDVISVGRGRYGDLNNDGDFSRPG